jgi:hypothetical protein
MTTKCRNWHAWLNTMPPKPDDFHVSGDVLVGNPGVTPVLTMREPQGINPTILLLDLHLVQQPGMWPQQMTCAAAKYSRVMPPGSKNYTAVDIYADGERVALIDIVSVVS